MNRQAFVDYLGTEENRLPLETATADAIKGYEEKRNGFGIWWAGNVYKDDIIYIARLTPDPKDIRVIWRGVCAHDRLHRLGGAESEITLIYTHKAKLVKGTLENGVSLGELVDELGEKAFAPTERSEWVGGGGTSPYLMYPNQPGVKLSECGFSWLEERLGANLQEQ